MMVAFKHTHESLTLVSNENALHFIGQDLYKNKKNNNNGVSSTNNIVQCLFDDKSVDSLNAYKITLKYFTRRRMYAKSS